MTPQQRQQITMDFAQLQRDNAYEAEDYELESRRAEAEIQRADNEEDDDHE